MTLLAAQRQFHSNLLDPDAQVSGAPNAKFERGFGIYRNAYRARLISCLRESYERVWSWIGDEAFDRAAIHHLILHPPCSWTLDDAGAEFAATLSELFPDEPEVEELAWLEWQMQVAFKASDEAPIDPDRFTAMTREYGEAEWTSMRLFLSGSVALRQIKTACPEVWGAIDRGEPWTGRLSIDRPMSVLVWRQDLQPRFRTVQSHEAHALGLVLGQASFGCICAALGSDDAVSIVGAMLGRWITDGLVIDLSER